jgi:hypothetical protein
MEFEGVPLTRIGVMRRGKGVELDGAPLEALGWDHFAKLSRKTISRP